MMTADRPGTSSSSLLGSDSGMQLVLVNGEELLYVMSLLRWRDLSATKPEVCAALLFGSWSLNLA